MKRLIIILILLDAFAIISFSQQCSDDLILLLKYNEYTSCEVLKIDEQKTDEKNHFCDEVNSDEDDFSEYFPKKKVFYYDGRLELTMKDLILFWNYNNKQQIDKLPFTSSNIKIISVFNDTILKIQLNDTTIDLLPNQNITDTIIQVKKENNKLVKYSTSILVVNLGLIEKKNTIDNKEWKTKSYELGLDAQIFAEVMPVFRSGQNDFLKYLMENVKYSDLDRLEITNTKLVIQFIIDENGEITMTRILRSINPIFDGRVIEVMNNMPKWKPAMHNGKAIPLKMTYPINFEFE